MGEIMRAADTEAAGLRFRATGQAGEATDPGGKPRAPSLTHSFASSWRTT